MQTSTDAGFCCRASGSRLYYPACRDEKRIAVPSPGCGPLCPRNSGGAAGGGRLPNRLPRQPDDRRADLPGPRPFGGDALATVLFHLFVAALYAAIQLLLSAANWHPEY